ncbi:MAG: YfcE family phosphodiesterase [Alphaproteobacteria bacterium]|nr:YfcE family phosphodiesterase [Alphaproteobacteria bacterium]
MQIIVLSDIHDSMVNLKQVVSDANIMKIPHIVFCGDFCSPIPAKFLASEFEGEIHAVFGNSEDRNTTPTLSENFPNFHHYGDIAKFDLEGKKIAVVHYPDQAEALAKSGAFDFVFSGHTHKHSLQEMGKTIWVNPGDLMGFKENPHYALVDLETREVKFIQV